MVEMHLLRVLGYAEFLEELFPIGGIYRYFLGIFNPILLDKF